MKFAQAALILGVTFCVLMMAWYFVASKKSDILAQDGCLDGGGCWDYGAAVCRKHEVNAQALCDRNRPERSTKPE